MDIVLNPKLAALCSKEWLTPYIAYERIRQLLAPYYVTIKSVHMLSDESGNFVVPLTPRIGNRSIEYLHFKYIRDDNIGASNYIINAFLAPEIRSMNENETTWQDDPRWDEARKKLEKSKSWMDKNSEKNAGRKITIRRRKEPVRKTVNRDVMPQTVSNRVTVGNYAV